ncbi:alpha-galactosidase [Streptomyces tateyamensis]|uniref:Alpha-galactosidase n=1 Tax=Streptomyces tateyamensis TaxID=565073 RepID=A0A2V4P2U5_9ACTN|nr:ricin-type beta-trefoil lectin domain protein [Streptomyces tateyamensis]PYC78577.1 alpha-galactosidase [Streptomyces tateyamensis]
MHIRQAASSLLRRKAAAVAVLALVVPAVPAVALATAPVAAAAAPDSTVATTPQLGFNTWNAFGCAPGVDGKPGPTEALIKSTADAIHSNGMQAAGYTYINIDDCWMTHDRDGNGNLVADPARFPDGINGVADYVHSLGLKLGIYESAGTMTCQQFPGSLGHEGQDANLFAAWGVDYLKYDNCYNNGVPSRQRYTAMRDALAATGHHILYSICNWGEDSPWIWGAATGNSWRTTGDINASYGSMLSIFHANVGLGAWAGPHHWNDPDMLEVGNGMSAIEDRSEFSLWSMMAAPLIAGNDFGRTSPDALATLTNARLIAVDQDSLSQQAHLVDAAGGLDVLAKPLAGGDVAVALFNEGGSTATISTSAAAVGKTGAASYGLTDLWSGATSSTTGAISASVPAHGTVVYRLSGGNATALNAGVLNGAGSGKCLDQPHGDTNPVTGVQLQLFTCKGSTNQVFTRTAANQITLYTGAATLCLDAFNNQTTAGTKVQTWTCNGQTNQQWKFNADGSITGVQSGLCLDATGATTTDGTLLELWTCNGGSNQKFTLS